MLAFFFAGALLNNREKKKLISPNQALALSFFWPLACLLVIVTGTYNLLIKMFNKVSES
jgi:hypothetical protein